MLFDVSSFYFIELIHSFLNILFSYLIHCLIFLILLDFFLIDCFRLKGFLFAFHNVQLIYFFQHLSFYFKPFFIIITTTILIFNFHLSTNLFQSCIGLFNVLIIASLLLTLLQDVSLDPLFFKKKKKINK